MGQCKRNKRLTMRDQFYVVLPSNSSMQYFPENTTTYFVTKLSKEVQLHGDWVVALTEIQIPLTFQHLSDDKIDRTVWVETATSEYAPRTPDQIVNITGLELQAEISRRGEQFGVCKKSFDNIGECTPYS